MKKYIVRLIDTFRNLFRRKSNIIPRPAAVKDYAYNQKRANNRAELDRLLDKINKHGRESLTKSERNFLKSTHEF